MKTVFLTLASNANLGGVETRQSRLAALLPERGWRAVFGLTQGNRFHDPGAFRKQFPGLDTVALDGRTGSREGRVLAVRRTLRKTRADVLMPGPLIDSFDAIRALKAEGSNLRCVLSLCGVYLPNLAYARAQ